MRIIFVTARHDGDNFENMLAPSIQKIQTKCVNVSDNPNSVTDTKTVSDKYNVGIKTAIENNLVADDSIIVLAKPNSSAADPNFVAKLYYVFDSRPDVGIVGIRGVSELNDGVCLYDPQNNPLNGLVYNITDIQNGQYIGENQKGFHTNVVAVDDSIIAIRGKVLLSMEKLFSISTDTGYGIEASINVLKLGYTVSVADIFAISSDNTDLSSEEISNITSQLEVKYPVSVDSLNIVKNFIIDVEL